MYHRHLDILTSYILYLDVVFTCYFYSHMLNFKFFVSPDAILTLGFTLIIHVLIYDIL